MFNGKFPGHDGLTKQFHDHFGDNFKVYFLHP